MKRLGLMIIAVVLVAAVSYTEFFYGQPVFSGNPGSWDDRIREKFVVVQEAGFYEAWYTGHNGSQANSHIGYAFSKDGVRWQRWTGPVIQRASQDQDPAVWKDASGYTMVVEVNDGERLDLFISANGIDWVQDQSWLFPLAASPVLYWTGIDWVLIYEDFSVTPFDVKLVRSPTLADLLLAQPILVHAGLTDAVPDSMIFDGALWHIYIHIKGSGSEWPAYEIESADLLTFSPPQPILPGNWTSPSIFRDPDGSVYLYAWDLTGDDRMHRWIGDDIPPPPSELTWHLDDSPIVTLIQGTPQIANGVLTCSGDDFADTGVTIGGQWSYVAWVDGSPPANSVANGPIHQENTMIFSWDHPNALFRGAVAMRNGGWHASDQGISGRQRYAATYDGETLIAYLNGVEVSRNEAPSGPALQSGTSLHFCQTSVSGVFWQGTLEDVRIYTRALTPAEIFGL